MMKLKRLAALVTALAALSLASCGAYDDGREAEDIAAPPAQTRDTDEDVAIGRIYPDRLTPPTLPPNELNDQEADDPMDNKFTDAAFSLAAELFKLSSTDALENGVNVMLSPWSVMQALALAANGADGETLDQFETLLGQGMALDEINSHLSDMIASAKADEDVKLGIANSIWVRNDVFSLKTSYQDTCLEKLDAAAFAIPFDKSGADKLNGWVAEKTDDMIPRLIDGFDPLDRAVLVNCLVFKGEWAQEYDDFAIDENSSFTNANGEKEDCTMLLSCEAKYLSGDGVTGFVKPYKGGRYAFAALLPSEDSSVAELARSLDGEKLRTLLNGADGLYEIDAHIPEFKFDFGKSIAKDLAAMGLDKAFTSEADLSHMSDEELYIGDVIHKTYIELDRTGTKAAAATGIMLRTMSIEPQKQRVTVKLDRPFMFAIIDTENDLPVFIGAVNSIK